MWKSLGGISLEEVINTRFFTFFKEYGRVVDGFALKKTYRSYLNKGTWLLMGHLIGGEFRETGIANLRNQSA
ncbi:hypothetical protein [Peribacillus sp. ACCC06369]|uniref:hypothetical protein n=1 Tax=unclassified Peribacillus TaxID=2675266 RepID=UPI0025A1146C|nr:hypothetical protein [Peribacillus sp. ACCC06369]